MGGTRQKEKKDETRKSLALRKKLEAGKHSEICGTRDTLGMETYFRGPMAFTKTLKQRFRVGDLDLPSRKKRYAGTNIRKEEDVPLGQNSPSGGM